MEGLLSTGPTPSSLRRKKVQQIRLRLGRDVEDNQRKYGGYEEEMTGDENEVMGR